ncbi:uncharacterized protein TNCV_3912751 [Trichonephila clavipes]|nr:uncharacterized protein TNCV_3912751 [Trichonephila clavipes]
MAYLGKGRREDLFVLATELNLKFDKSMTIATLKDLIISSEDYDEELIKNIHSTIVEDRKAREENLRIEEQKEKLRIEEREEKLRFEQLRLDEQKREYEFELEKLRIQLGADTSKESDTKFLVKEISKFIHRFDLKEDISLYLKLFERQAQRLNIDQENWVSHLLGLLPTEVSHIIAREPDDKANSHEHVKDLLLKRFKLTPEKFRQLFVTHQKASERTWIDFYHELNTYFNGWIDGLKIDTFNKLNEKESGLDATIETVATVSMQTAAKEAKYVNGHSDVPVAIDGTWQKRGHTSLNGAVIATSSYSGKVLDASIFPRFCKCLNKTHNENCKANHFGNSGSMEVPGAIEDFQLSENLHGLSLRCTKFWEDGDSRAYKAVNEMQPYGDIGIEKLECIGHVEKRMGTRLRGLKLKMKGKKLNNKKHWVVAIDLQTLKLTD